ncbi:MAG: hypothetical protein ABFR95_09935 [Actinomycetota bacterium]
MRDHLKKRLTGLHTDMNPEISERHMAEITREIKSPSAVTPARHRAPSIRRMGLAIAAATILLVPVAAFAADDAMPGEFLYPIKRTTERVHSLFDSDVQARHRVEEVEVLLDREADPEFIMERVRVAEQHLGDDEAALVKRFAVARERAEIRVQTEASETADPERTQDSRDEEPSQGSGEGSSTTEPSAEQEQEQQQSGTGTGSSSSGQSDDPPRTGNNS